MGATTNRLVLVTALAATTTAVISTSATAGRPDDAGLDRAAAVAAHWTPERVAAAQPRDLVVDERGLGYLKGADGALTPHGHDEPARLVATVSPGLVDMPTPRAKPPRGDDTTAPTIADMNPGAGSVIGGSAVFSATVTDDGSGVKSVSFVIVYPTGQTQSIVPAASGSAYTVEISGFSDGDWAWYVTAKDNGARGGNTAETDLVAFTVTTGGGSDPDPVDPPPADIVTNERYAAGGDVQLAAGRILFEMPTIVRRGRNTREEWNAYVCSGTAVSENHQQASLILTAAHCVYDDVSKAFARNVLFIPNQDGTSGAGTDSNCDNDPIGCWSPSHGVVDANWTTREFPDNIEWDYAYYVVPDTEADNGHSGAGADIGLESAVNELDVLFAAPVFSGETHALGYSYSDDPHFMYCREDRRLEPTDGVDYWLPNCGLSGGSSGGPWISSLADGRGPIVSVNSWGYTNAPGMAGPFLDGSAQCVYDAVHAGAALNEDRGVVVSGCAD